MFEPLPNREASRGFYTTDVVYAKDVHAAISEAEAKQKEARRRYDEVARNLSPDELNDGFADFESQAERDTANLARISAVLLTAIHIEGAINAWGVYVAGADFFKAHIERCPLESKIALTLALIGKGCIPKNHPAIIAVHDLFERRNQIAHRKTKEWQNGNIPNHARMDKADSMSEGSDLP